MKRALFLCLALLLFLTGCAAEEMFRWNAADCMRAEDGDILYTCDGTQIRRQDGETEAALPVLDEETAEQAGVIHSIAMGEDGLYFLYRRSSAVRPNVGLADPETGEVTLDIAGTCWDARWFDADRIGPMLVAGDTLIVSGDGYVHPLTLIDLTDGSLTEYPAAYPIDCSDGEKLYFRDGGYGIYAYRIEDLLAGELIQETVYDGAPLVHLTDTPAYDGIGLRWLRMEEEYFMFGVRLENGTEYTHFYHFAGDMAGVTEVLD